MFTNKLTNLSGIIRTQIPKQCCSINLTHTASLWIGSYKIRDPSAYIDRFPKPKRWPRYNELKQPPQLDPNEEPRPATMYHYRDNVKTSPKKMWYVLKFIRGMSVDEAIKQCSFMPYKTAQITAELLKEAQDVAIRKHNFEFKSNMWVEDARVGKGLVMKGVRKHARMRFGVINYFYSHIMLKLTEGEPPQDFYRPKRDGNDCIKEFYDKLRSRKIDQGL